MANNNLHSRKRNDQGQSAEVNKRGEGLGGEKSGNADYGNRETQTSETTSTGKRGKSGSPKRSGGGMGLIGLLAAALLFGGGSGLSGLLGGSSTTTTTTPVATAVTNNTTTTTTGSTNGYNFGTAVTNNQTYVNVNATDSAVNTTVSSGARDKYTTLKGNGNDQVTVMVYMCGTDLESNYGMATADLNEMAYAEMSDKVNIIIQSGGTKKWQNSIMTSRQVQRWRLTTNGTQKGLERLGDLGSMSMTDSGTLSDFIQFAAKNYPANRYILIFWDHGGGSVSGYGYDEVYPNGSMTIDQIAKALNNGGVKFDIVGFDACLMATLETAIAIEPYADYLLASEETEPGTGWYHTNWLTLLAQNSSVSSLEIGKQIADDFCTVQQTGSTSRDQNTLSMIDLAELSATVPEKLSTFSKKVSETVQSSDYQTVSQARGVTKEFASSSKIDQIDLIHFCNTLNTTESKALAEALQSCIKYNRTRNVKNAYGISIYFPYRNRSYVNSMLSIYNSIGFDTNYTSAIKSFATLSTSGQVYNNYTSNSLFDMLGGSSSSNGLTISSSELLDLLTGGSGYSSGGGLDLASLLGGSSAVDTSSLTTDLLSAIIGRSAISSDSLVLTEKDGGQVLALNSSDWEKVQAVKLNVWIDDGNGYIDLGLDNIFEFDDDGALKMDYDGMWLAINGQPISYYMISDEYTDENDYITTGYVPAILTRADGEESEEVNLIIEFTPDNPGGIVAGAQKKYDTDVEGKGLIEISEGDKIDFICDYYDYNGNFSDRYYLGDQLTVGEEGLTVSDVDISSEEYIYGYQLTDAFNGERYTPMLTK